MVAVTVAVLAGGFAALRLRSGGDGAAAPGAAKDGPAAVAAKSGPVTFAIAGSAADHFVPEPCSRIPSGGLVSMKPFFDAVLKAAPPVLPVYLGDVTEVPGDLGRAVAGHHYPEVVQACGPKIMVAGARDLALGSAFAKGALKSLPFPALCANAMDALGQPILKGWQLVDVSGSTVLTVGSVAQSLQDEISAAGSDVRLGPARDAIAIAVSEGEAQARQLERKIAARVLFHHGTVEETAALVREISGFSFAVAARGADLPSQDPAMEGVVPIFDAGRGLRFAWVATVEDGKTVRWSLVRFGIELLAAGSPVSEALNDHPYVIRDVAFPKIAGGDDARLPDPRGTYVGSQRCAACHSEQCGEHDASAHRKLPERFAPEATGNVQCIACHFTGALRRTGWKGRDDTSDLAGVSCEACHGPGSAHAETPGTEYGRFDLAQCRTCHTPDRAPAFDAKDLWERWKHGQRR